MHSENASPHIFTDIAALRRWRHTVESIALVPTLGNLHSGHLALIEEAKKYASHIVVSIFVNRLQFGAGEDFERYPRTLSDDVMHLNQIGVSAVFCPAENELYPRLSQQYQIDSAVHQILCGAFRPGHFRGVATIVTKLFNIVQPQFAVFGKKDFQQLFIIKELITQFNFPIQLLAVETARSADNLALSSRNRYLSDEERLEAPQLYQHLHHIQHSIKGGAKNYRALEQHAQNSLSERGWKVDYVQICCADTLEPAIGDTKQLVVLIAAYLGTTRLIDNIEIDLTY